MIEAVVIGDREVAQRLFAFTPSLTQRLTRTIARLTITLQGKVKRDKLSGDPLRNRTGHLRASVAQQVTVAGETITGRVGLWQGPAVKYGAVHEFGGTFTVKAHLRTITKAWGRPVREPHKVPVRAHAATYPERSFLRSALAEMRPQIVADIERAVDLEVQRMRGGRA